MFETISKVEAKEILKELRVLQKEYYEGHKDELYYGGEDRLFYSNVYNNRIYGKMGQYYFYSLPNGTSQPREVKVAKNVRIDGRVLPPMDDKPAGVVVSLETDVLDVVCDKKGRVKGASGSHGLIREFLFIPTPEYTLETCKDIDIKAVMETQKDKIKEVLQRSEISEIDWVLKNHNDIVLWECFKYSFGELQRIKTVKNTGEKEKEILKNLKMPKAKTPKNTR